MMHRKSTEYNVLQCAQDKNRRRWKLADEDKRRRMKSGGAVALRVGASSSGDLVRGPPLATEVENPRRREKNRLFKEGAQLLILSCVS